MQLFAKTDKGMVRNTNQDSFAVNTLPGDSAVAIVCDGMGGASAGDIASKTACEVISQYVLKSYTTSMTSEDIAKLLKNAIISANFEVFSLSKSDENLRGMGTTVVAAIVNEQQTVICNIGDSRAYLLNADGLRQITRDHSMVQSLVESGKLSQEEANTHPKKNIITRALGVEENLLIDSFCIDLTSNDKLLLCTDGLSNYVTSDEILQIVCDNSSDKAVEILIDKANLAGGRDNITAVLIDR
ncbi:MAG: Stp1/IreP family PP2C-type Ser/Thr phosphatase [Clostridia bacterium]|nr:Stp1/IreP family PP2C-type Ser/Thr phosphatase [Clostridia bacterium]